MDALERLAEKNKKHAEIQRKDRKMRWKLIPFILIFLVVYFGVFGFVTDFDGEQSPDELTEMSIQVWLFSMVLTFGIGACLILRSLMNALVIESVRRLLTTSKVAYLALMTCLFPMAIGLFFIYLGFWFDELIKTHESQISKFMRFGFDATPGLIEMAANGVIVFVAIFFAFICYSMLCILPSIHEGNLPKWINTKNN